MNRITEEDVREWCYKKGLTIIDNALYLEMRSRWSASVQRWIPCSERLPYAEYGESDLVLTTCGYRDAEDTSFRWIRMMYFNGGNWCYPTGETYEEKVYAWMPLPEPYKDDEQNG